MKYLVSKKNGSGKYQGECTFTYADGAQDFVKFMSPLEDLKITEVDDWTAMVVSIINRATTTLN